MPLEDKPAIRALNLAICQALGVADPATVTQLQLRVLPGRWPTVRVDRALRNADGLAHVVQDMRLVPAERAAEAPKEGHAHAR